MLAPMSGIGRATSTSDRRILIVEDDRVTAAAFERILRLDGYAVRTATTAEDALRQIESQPPDAIVADFRIPDMDALEFLRRVRMREECRSTPVAVVTADYDLPTTVMTTLADLGAVVRFKPLWLEDLRSLVGTMLTP